MEPTPTNKPIKRGRPKKSPAPAQDASLPQLLKKPSEMIQITTTVSFISRKMWNVMIINALNTLGDEEHKIEASLLLNSIGWEGSHRTDIIETCLHELISASVSWNVVDGKRNEFSATALIASARYNRVSGEIFYHFAPVLKELIRNPAIYGMIDLGLQSKFTSRYTLPLYEQAARYYNPDEVTSSPLVPIELFTSMLGKPENRELKLFKRDLELPIKELNQSAPFGLDIEYQRGKSGRGYAFVQLNIKPKPIETSIMYDEALLGRLKDLGITDTKARFTLADYPDEHIKKHLDAVEEVIAHGAAIKNPAGYFLDAISKDYVYGMVVKNKIMANVKAKRKAQLKEDDEESQKQLAEQLRQDEVKEKRRISVFTAWQAMPDAERQAILAEFELSIRANAIVLEQYRSKGLSTGIVSSIFYSHYGDRILSIKGAFSMEDKE